jgi:hypothetical protein
MDHQFTTCKVMAMKVVLPKTHARRVTTRQGNNNNNKKGFM